MLSKVFIPQTKLLRKSSGYSLIELLVVFTILGIILAISQNNLRDSQRRNQIRSGRDLLKADILLAQEYARAGKKPSSGLCTGANTYEGHGLQYVSGSVYRIVADCTGGYVTEKEVNVSPLQINSPNPNPVIFSAITGIPRCIGVTCTALSTEIRVALVGFGPAYALRPGVQIYRSGEVSNVN